MPLTPLAYLKKGAFVISFFFAVTTSFAQTMQDTAKRIELDEVVVKAYEQNRRLKDIPAAVNYIGRQTLERFGSASVVQAINTTPGVRMEERSPGSYRFNIRGSALRSPFGVRNVKFYYNDLPFTNPGGHTNLNGLGYYNFGSVEIIKGPGSSLYGAGTGGVLLTEHMTDGEQPGAFTEYAVGSYGLQNVYGSVVTGTDKYKSKIGFQHQQSDGYRDHSALQRDVLSWTGNFNLGETRNLKTTFVYSDLFYETPGAITAAEYEVNPKAARSGNAFFPGAEAANASVQQRTFLAGASYTQQLLPQLHNKTVLYGAYTQLHNPTVQNYARAAEPHFGGRTTFTFLQPLSTSMFTLNGGAELQQGFTNVSIHQNQSGIADTLQEYYEVGNRQSLIFAQATWEVKSWTAVAGASLNKLTINYQPFFPQPVAEQQRKLSNKLAPRIALLKKWNHLTLYSSIAKGFSPPTTEEFFPSGGLANINLNAEDGINYDIGFRGSYKRLNVDINAFHFSLKNTIVQQRTAGGGSQFLNAGNTSQNGIETGITYPLLENSLFIDRSTFWISHTYHNFIYKNFTKDTIAFSGKNLPGIAPHTLSAGFDVQAINGLLATISYLYTGETPLTNANTIYADSYHLLGAKIGFHKNLGANWRVKLIAGVDNLLDEKYSLGNDINGFGGRYFNAAPGRNWYSSLVFQWLK